ncbi:transposase, partial [Streptosporangium subroseum]|uniref:transposase n=1 Tax=Streptosporangium subroseum TaxID=106412 RepID=UPI0034145E8D
MSGQGMVKRQRGHKARLELTDAQVAALDEQGSAAITMWNCLHAYWTHFAGKRPTLAQADAAIRQARKDADFLAVLPAQAAQAILKNRLVHTYDQIAKLRAKAKRRAYDWQHQTTTALARHYSAIVVEDLHIANMMRSASGTVQAPGTNVAQKRGLNRAISGESWGRTVTFLTYKATEWGGCVPKVPAQGTSTECHRCHTTTAGSRES